MKNIILNSVQLASSFKLDASYCFNLPPQYKGGFSGFFLKNGLILLGLGLILGVLSCEDKTYKSSISPKAYNGAIDTLEPIKPTTGITQTPTGRRVVYLNNAKFTVDKGKKGEEKLSEVLLKDGVVELQNIYSFASPDSEIRKILEETRAILSQDFVDETAFNERGQNTKPSKQSIWILKVLSILPMPWLWQVKMRLMGMK